MDNNRILIIDYNHMAHTYMHSQHRLSKTLVVNGQPELVDTTVQSGTIKSIHKWSNGGRIPTAVCFDSPVPVRKAYFAKSFEDMDLEGPNAYKGSRAPMSEEMFKAITMTANILNAAGVSCFKGHNYEADDLIMACIVRAQQLYGYDVPIDVVTNDADLLPLVDDQVSVFLRSRKYTYAESKDLEKAHYIQVTPDNFQEVVEDLSAYKKFHIPYNTLLLHKLLRGDTSDQLGGKAVSKMFPPKVYNDMVIRMEDAGEDFSSIFRYGKPRSKIVDVKTGKEFVSVNEALASGVAKDSLMQKYSAPEELDMLLGALGKYMPDKLDKEYVLDYVKKMYLGMNLNQAYPNFGAISRRPAVVKGAGRFDEIALQREVSTLGINLRLK